MMEAHESSQRPNVETNKAKLLAWADKMKARFETLYPKHLYPHIVCEIKPPTFEHLKQGKPFQINVFVRDKSRIIPDHENIDIANTHFIYDIYTEEAVGIQPGDEKVFADGWSQKRPELSDVLITRQIDVGLDTARHNQTMRQLLYRGKSDKNFIG